MENPGMEQAGGQSAGNRLGEASSVYLRSARHQPVHWREWGQEAFAEAERAGKPVLLDIGAVWCHWCHVMDRESYENPEIAGLINELYVPVKVDRDERPDVDSRYQAAVASISGQSGWPLTAFLTPGGKPFSGGTYFPPEDRYGRPGFPRVLRGIAEAYRNQRDDVNESAESVGEAIEHDEMFIARGNGEPGEVLLERILETILQTFDPRHGGFGAQPKFPYPATLELLIDAATRPGPTAERARKAVLLTLDKMAAGGIHDQLAGGFHRYSVDERWIVPHFEKMAYDNSELLRAYTHAFESFPDPRLAKVAASTLRWMDAWMSDRERGGFYASQDADASLEDDGDYFTWSRAEAEAVLSPGEFELAAAFFNLRAVGDMHGKPDKNVLHIVTDARTLAGRLDRREEDVAALLEGAREKLYAARLERRTPFVDRTIYTGWNGLCLSAYMAAGRVLALPATVQFALKSLDRVLETAWNPAVGLARVVAYSDVDAEPKRVAAVLDDYAFVANAALDAWEATGEPRYFEAAERMAKVLLHRFYDAAEGGFFDTDQSGDEPRLGVLGARRKPVQDAPTPAGNPAAATLLLRLHTLTGEAVYRSCALETLEIFAGVAEHLGLPAASYGLALRRAITPPVQVCVIGEDGLADDLAAAASARFQVNKSVLRLRREHLASLPPALARTLPHLPGVQAGSLAVICRGNVCLPPVDDPRRLRELLAADEEDGSEATIASI